MTRHLLPLFLSLFLLSCSNEEESSDAILHRPPYDKITDSIRMAPNNPELYYHRGSLFYHNNQLLHAEQDLRKAWQLSPTEEYALAVTTVLREKNKDSAISFVREALKKIPNSLTLKIALARGYQQKGLLQEALNISDQVLAQYPNSLDALLLKSDILQQQNKTAEALAAKELALKYAPGDIDLAYDLAYDYAAAKDEKALKLTEYLLRIDSTENKAKGYYVKATYYNNVGNTNEAVRYYDAAISTDYNFLDAYLDKGELLLKQKKYRKALQVFELGQRISPATAEFYFAIAKTQEAMGNKTEAKLNYKKAYSLDKTMTDAKVAAEKL